MSNWRSLSLSCWSAAAKQHPPTPVPRLTSDVSEGRQGAADDGPVVPRNPGLAQVDLHTCGVNRDETVRVWHGGSQRAAMTHTQPQWPDKTEQGWGVFSKWSLSLQNGDRDSDLLEGANCSSGAAHPPPWGTHGFPAPWVMAFATRSDILLSHRATSRSAGHSGGQPHVTEAACWVTAVGNDSDTQGGCVPGAWLDSAAVGLGGPWGRQTGRSLRGRRHGPPLRLLLLRDSWGQSTRLGGQAGGRGAEPRDPEGSDV